MNKLNALIEKLKEDFNDELRDIRFKIQQEEMKRFNDSINQMDVRVKDIETKKFEHDRKNDDEINKCKLKRREKDKRVISRTIRKRE